MSSLVADVKRIAVLRANGIGDVIFALPAFQALDAAYPGAEIVLLGAPWHAELLQDRPGPIDRVVVVPPTQGVRLPPGEREDDAEQQRFFAAMQAEQFDVALQLHGGGRYSNPFVQQLGARVTAGMRAFDAEPLDRWVRYTYWQSELLRYLEVVALVGAHPTGLEPVVAVTAADVGEVDEALAAAGVPDAPIVVLTPGASDRRRRWPADRFAEVADALAEEGAAVVVAGDAHDDVDSAKSILGAMQQPAWALAGRLSLGGTAALLARSRLVIGNDSGPIHLAAAVGAATVGVYWCGNRLNATPATTHRHRSVLSWRLECPVCGVDCMSQPDGCPHDASFVADVEAKEVLAEALDLLALP